MSFPNSVALLLLVVALAGCVHGNEAESAPPGWDLASFHKYTFKTKEGDSLALAVLLGVSEPTRVFLRESGEVEWDPDAPMRVQRLGAVLSWDESSIHQMKSTSAKQAPCIETVSCDWEPIPIGASYGFTAPPGQFIAWTTSFGALEGRLQLDVYVEAGAVVRWTWEGATEVHELSGNESHRSAAITLAEPSLVLVDSAEPVMDYIAIEAGQARKAFVREAATDHPGDLHIEDGRAVSIASLHGQGTVTIDATGNGKGPWAVEVLPGFPRLPEG